jgi:hypothetical protein
MSRCRIDTNRLMPCRPVSRASFSQPSNLVGSWPRRILRKRMANRRMTVSKWPGTAGHAADSCRGPPAAFAHSGGPSSPGSRHRTDRIARVVGWIWIVARTVWTVAPAFGTGDATSGRSSHQRATLRQSQSSSAQMEENPRVRRCGGSGHPRLTLSGSTMPRLTSAGPGDTLCRPELAPAECREDPERIVPGSRRRCVSGCPGRVHRAKHHTLAPRSGNQPRKSLSRVPRYPLTTGRKA